jgi:hypothetical protein
MNRDPGFSSDFAAANASTLVWLVLGAIVLINSNTILRFLEITQ